MNEDFEKEELSEEEFEDDEFEDEEEVEDFIKYIRELPIPEVSVLNPARVKQMQFVYAMIKNVLQETGSDAVIEVKTGEPLPTTGVIWVHGADLNIANTEGFARASEFANSMQIYSISENRVRISFMFYGLLNPISLQDSPYK